LEEITMLKEHITSLKDRLTDLTQLNAFSSEMRSRTSSSSYRGYLMHRSRNKNNNTKRNYNNNTNRSSSSPISDEDDDASSSSSLDDYDPVMLEREEVLKQCQRKAVEGGERIEDQLVDALRQVIYVQRNGEEIDRRSKLVIRNLNERINHLETVIVAMRVKQYNDEDADADAEEESVINAQQQQQRGTDQVSDNNISLAVGEFPDGIGLRATVDIPVNDDYDSRTAAASSSSGGVSIGRISPQLTISPHHHIAAAAIHEIGVGDLPDNTWIEQRGLFSSSSSPHQFMAVTNGTSMEGWLQEGDTICNEALRWLLYTYNEDVREVLPTAASSSSSTADDDGISAAERSSDESTVTSSSSNKNDKSVDGILSLTDVRWAYILLKGYGAWGEDDYYYYHSNHEDTITSPTPMLISPLVFARPHYRKGSRIINYNVVYPDTSHGRASGEVIINSDEEPSSSYSDHSDNDEDRNNREHDGEY
ncbi:hypothetical protein FOL46_001212, partial [Perkinsus olseni]